MHSGILTPTFDRLFASVCLSVCMRNSVCRSGLPPAAAIRTCPAFLYSTQLPERFSAGACCQWNPTDRSARLAEQPKTAEVSASGAQASLPTGGKINTETMRHAPKYETPQPFSGSVSALIFPKPHYLEPSSAASARHQIRRRVSPVAVGPQPKSRCAPILFYRNSRGARFLEKVSCQGTATK